MPGLGVGTAAGAGEKGTSTQCCPGLRAGVKVVLLGKVGGTGSPQWGEGTGLPSGGQRDREPPVGQGTGSPGRAGGPRLELAELEVKRVCSSQLRAQARTWGWQESCYVPLVQV